MENKEETTSVNNEERKSWDKYFEELEDSDFKNFYEKNFEERIYLRKKVEGKDLADFAKRKFSLRNILQCLYVKEFRTEFNIKRKKFKEEVRAYVSEKHTEYKGSDTDKLVKYSVGYIESRSVNCTDEKKRLKFHPYSTFSGNARRKLFQTLTYIFYDPNVMERFKVNADDNDNDNYEFSSLEAMLVFFIMDDEYRQDINYIKKNKGEKARRKFIDAIMHYLIAITIPKKKTKAK